MRLITALIALPIFFLQASLSWALSPESLFQQALVPTQPVLPIATSSPFVTNALHFLHSQSPVVGPEEQPLFMGMLETLHPHVHSFSLQEKILFLEILAPLTEATSPLPSAQRLLSNLLANDLNFALSVYFGDIFPDRVSSADLLKRLCSDASDLSQLLAYQDTPRFGELIGTLFRQFYEGSLTESLQAFRLMKALRTRGLAIPSNPFFEEIYATKMALIPIQLKEAPENLTDWIQRYQDLFEELNYGIDALHTSGQDIDQNQLLSALDATWKAALKLIPRWNELGADSISTTYTHLSQLATLTVKVLDRACGRGEVGEMFSVEDLRRALGSLSTVQKPKFKDVLLRLCRPDALTEQAAPFAMLLAFLDAAHFDPDIERTLFQLLQYDCSGNASLSAMQEYIARCIVPRTNGIFQETRALNGRILSNIHEYLSLSADPRTRTDLTSLVISDLNAFTSMLQTNPENISNYPSDFRRELPGFLTKIITKQVRGTVSALSLSALQTHNHPFYREIQTCSRTFQEQLQKTSEVLQKDPLISLTEAQWKQLLIQTENLLYPLTHEDFEALNRFISASVFSPAFNVITGETALSCPLALDYLFIFLHQIEQRTNRRFLSSSVSTCEDLGILQSSLNEKLKTLPSITPDAFYLSRIYLTNTLAPLKQAIEALWDDHADLCTLPHTATILLKQVQDNSSLANLLSPQVRLAQLRPMPLPETWQELSPHVLTLYKDLVSRSWGEAPSSVMKLPDFLELPPFFPGMHLGSDAAPSVFPGALSVLPAPFGASMPFGLASMPPRPPLFRQANSEDDPALAMALALSASEAEAAPSSDASERKTDALLIPVEPLANTSFLRYHAWLQEATALSFTTGISKPLSAALCKERKATEPPLSIAVDSKARLLAQNRVVEMIGENGIVITLSAKVVADFSPEALSLTLHHELWQAKHKQAPRYSKAANGETKLEADSLIAMVKLYTQEDLKEWIENLQRMVDLTPDSDDHIRENLNILISSLHFLVEQKSTVDTLDEDADSCLIDQLLGNESIEKAKTQSFYEAVSFLKSA